MISSSTTRTRMASRGASASRDWFEGGSFAAISSSKCFQTSTRENTTGWDVVESQHKAAVLSSWLIRAIALYLYLEFLHIGFNAPTKFPIQFNVKIWKYLNIKKIKKWMKRTSTPSVADWILCDLQSLKSSLRLQL